MTHFKLFFIFILISASPLLAQDDYVNDDQLRYEDWVYKSNIKTALLHESSWDNAAAILPLNGTEKL
jgi:hypothetical protein